MSPFFLFCVRLVGLDLQLEELFVCYKFMNDFKLNNVPRHFVLNNGVVIPSVGFGTYKLGDSAVVCHALTDAIAAGYRSIDCASYYGNQQAIGEAIASCEVPRSELFIGSKLWVTDCGYDSALRAFDRTLSELRLDFLDMYMIHWPVTERQTPDWRGVNADTWRAMERLVNEGRVGSIGVCNFKPAHLEPLMERASIMPAVNQIEFHPGDNQVEMVEFCQRNDIRVEAWSPLARGRIMHNKVLADVAGRYGVSVAQVCLRWCLQHGVIPLPKSVNSDRIKANIDLFGFSLAQSDMEKIDALDGIDNSGLDPDTVSF